MSRYGYLLAFLVPALVVAGFYLGGWWNMLALGFIFIAEPILDVAGGLNTRNFEGDEAKNKSNERFYKLLLYVWVVVQVFVLVWASYIIGMGFLENSYEWIGFLAGIGLVTGGIGISVAHELGHKKSKFEKFLSQFLLMTVGYMHFYIEHNQGHHRNVATPEDPATARKDESFYRFWFRTVFGSYVNAWKIENNRLNKKGHSAFSIHNRMIRFQILPLVFLASMTFVFMFYSGVWAWEIPVFLILQGIIAFTLLELVNYVEHYGILRKEISPGRYEKVNPEHAWNANHKLSNYFLFQLQRHSDHHITASRPYQILKQYEESPQLPAGYPTMIIAALVPPIWFSVMNPRLENWEQAIST